MPTIKGIPGPYRFFFYSADCREPPHLHVERGGCEAKYWILPLQAAYAGAFSSRELRRIAAIILEHRHRMLEAWDEHCHSFERDRARDQRRGD